jgi:hypothetical protein
MGGEEPPQLYCDTEKLPLRPLVVLFKNKIFLLLKTRKFVARYFLFGDD